MLLIGARVLYGSALRWSFSAQVELPAGADEAGPSKFSLRLDTYDRMLHKFIHAMRQYNRVRRILNKHPVDLKQIPQLSEWSKKSYSAPSPLNVKTQVLLRLISPGQHFIETGTYKGKTASAVRGAGHEVTTIEVHEPLYASVSPALKDQGIECILGDSGEVFPHLLPAFKDKDIYFWLDGHFSGGITGKGDEDTPIIKELECIKSTLLPTGKRITIAIDDFRLFPEGDTPTDYPTRNYLIDWARENQFFWDVEHDIFILKNWRCN